MRKLPFLILTSIILLLSSCNIISSKDNTAPALPNANLLIVNASPDSPPLGMYVNGGNIFNNLNYNDSVGYFQIGQSDFSMTFFKNDTTNYYVEDTTIIQTDTILYQVDTITVYKTDTTYTPTDSIYFQTDSLATLTIANIAVNAGNYYSLFLVDSASNLQTVYVTDNLQSPSSDSVKLRFFHFSSGLPAVDLAEAGGGPVLFSSRTFNDVSSNSSLENFTYFPSGTYNLELRLAGTSTVIASLPSADFSGGKIYTIYADGFGTGTGLQAPGISIITNK